LSLWNISDETWDAVCDSLKTHPTLQTLELRAVWTGAKLAPAMLKFRIQALEDMMKLNISIHSIRLHDRYSKHELFRGSVIPYLETNKFLPRVRAIQKTRPIAYRAKVLGAALFATRSDANSFWMLLSGNAEIAFPLTTVATSLPTAATPVNVAPVVATGSATAASNIVAPAAGQKRKACP
jgi:hypothetical protein